MFILFNPHCGISTSYYINKKRTTRNYRTQQFEINKAPCNSIAFFVAGIRIAMKREADGDMGSPQKRTRRGDEEVRLLIPSKVSHNS